MDPVFVSLGYACMIKGVLTTHSMSIPERLPFDYIVTDEQFVVDSLDTNFENWRSKENYCAKAVHKPNGYLRVIHEPSGTVFVHDMKCEHLIYPIDINSHYDSDGFSGNLPIKEDCLQLIINNYMRRADRLRNLILTKRPIIFTRFTLNKNLDDINRVYQSIKRYCVNGDSFIFLCIIDGPPDDSLKIIEETKNTLFVVTNGTERNLGQVILEHKKFLFSWFESEK